MNKTQQNFHLISYGSSAAHSSHRLVTEHTERQDESTITKDKYFTRRSHTKWSRNKWDWGNQKPKLKMSQKIFPHLYIIALFTIAKDGSQLGAQQWGMNIENV